MEDIFKLLKKQGIDLNFNETETDGFCLIESKAIFVNCHLDELRTIEVILHESKHILSHSDYMELYRASYIYHSKFENEANASAIDYIIEENGGLYNYTGLIEEFNIGIGYESRYERFIKQKNTLLTD